MIPPSNHRRSTYQYKNEKTKSSVKKSNAEFIKLPQDHKPDNIFKRIFKWIKE